MQTNYVKDHYAYLAHKGRNELQYVYRVKGATAHAPNMTFLSGPSSYTKLLVYSHFLSLPWFVKHHRIELHASPIVSHVSCVYYSTLNPVLFEVEEEVTE